jgi:hypothetical protein
VNYEEVRSNNLRSLADSLGQAQAINQANSYILMEIVRDIARSQPNPHKYISNMFERVSGRADRSPVEDEAHPVHSEFRKTIEAFFYLAGKNLIK